ncbi:MAG: sugar phosphate isomerase/epimerase family protein [Actinomycetota bacterium]
MWELDRAFGAIAEAGFKGMELMVTGDPDTQSAEAPLRLAKQEGLEIVALHAPMLLLTRRVWGPRFLPIIERSVALAKELGAGVVVIHPPFLWELGYQAWMLGRLNSYRSEHRIRIAVENMFRFWLLDRALPTYRWTSPKDLERFGEMTLDTSHCGVEEQDILEELDRVGGQIAHVHLSDSRANHRDNHAFPASGVLPLDRFLKRLPETGFAGAVSLELDLRDLAGDRTALVEALRMGRQFCEDHLG